MSENMGIKPDSKRTHKPRRKAAKITTASTINTVVKRNSAVGCQRTPGETGKAANACVSFCVNSKTDNGSFMGLGLRSWPLHSPALTSPCKMQKLKAPDNPLSQKLSPHTTTSVSDHPTPMWFSKTAKYPFFRRFFFFALLDRVLSAKKYHSKLTLL